jgi:hypothetical protein
MYPTYVPYESHTCFFHKWQMIQWQMIQCSDDTMIRWYNDQMIQWSDDTMIKRKEQKDNDQRNTIQYIDLFIFGV